MTISLKKIFKESLIVTWNNPVLWIFGFLVAIFNHNEVSLIGIHFQKVARWLDTLLVLRAIQNQFGKVLENLNQFNLITPRAIFNSTLVLIFFFLFLALIFLSQAILVKSTKGIKEKKVLPLQKIFQESREFIWTVFSLNLIALIVTYLPFLLFKIPGIYRLPIPIFVYLIFLILIAIIVSFINRLALCAIVLEKKSLFNSIQIGISLFFNNWWIIIKTSLLLFLFLLGFSLTIFLITLGCSFPFILLTGVLTKISFILFSLVLFLGILILGFLVFLGGSIINTFFFLVWAKLFTGLRKKS